MSENRIVFVQSGTFYHCDIQQAKSLEGSWSNRFYWQLEAGPRRRLIACGAVAGREAALAQAKAFILRHAYPLAFGVAAQTSQH